MSEAKLCTEARDSPRHRKRDKRENARRVRAKGPAYYEARHRHGLQIVNILQYTAYTVTFIIFELHPTHHPYPY